MPIKFSASIWFWFLLGMGASGLAVSMFGYFNPGPAIRLYAVWLIGWLAFAGLLSLIKR